MLIHKTMKMPTSCLSCWISPTCDAWVREKSKHKGYDNRLENCPLEEVKHGHWKYDNQYHWYRACCSECGYYRVTDIKADRWNEWKYCPSCGAKMDEVKVNNSKGLDFWMTKEQFSEIYEAEDDADGE